MTSTDIATEAANAVKERLNSSFFGPLIPIWLIYNWKIILVFFDGDLSAFIKIDQILDIYNKETLCPTIFPILITIFYIFATPFISEFIISINRYAEAKSHINSFKFNNQKAALTNLECVNSEATIKDLVIINKNLCDNYSNFLIHIDQIAISGEIPTRKIERMKYIIDNKKHEIKQFNVKSNLCTFNNLFLISQKITNSYSTTNVYGLLENASDLIRKNIRNLRGARTK